MLHIWLTKFGVGVSPQFDTANAAGVANRQHKGQEHYKENLARVRSVWQQP